MPTPSDRPSHSDPSALLQAQKMEMVGRMASSVIHDLNNYLTVIQLNAALLEDVGGDPGERARMLGEISRACMTAADLTRRMLSFARRRESRVEPVHLQPLLDELIGFLQCMLPRRAKIEADYCEAAAWIQGDRFALNQALMNLVLNALDAGSVEGVRLGLRLENREVEITVTDFGTGIRPEDLPRIFEPFFTTKSAEKGTGLGLPIVQRVAEEHGGRVEVQSECGQGATFRLFFPRLAEGERAPAETGPPPAPRRNGNGILVVEDDPGVRRIAGQMLKRSGYEVVEAADAAEAREAWESHPGKFALLFTDVVLPGTVSGEDLADELRRQEAGLRTLFTSGNAGALRKRDEPFVAKPYPPEVLL
ncbi:MAG TPA: ATP-binding protein, partial [Chthoniobacterales bacterium]